MDLARQMIELSGLTLRDEQNPDGDVEILITGLRPGEKLYEELLIDGVSESTIHPRIMRAKEEFIPWDKFEQNLRSLEIALNENAVDEIRLILQQLVTGYHPIDSIVDFVYLREQQTEQ
jgi:FlaA1/EpsC-like NDP-sugar epimerase